MTWEDVKQVSGDVWAFIAHTVVEHPAAVVMLSALLVGAGRFTVPGHDLTGWPGLYEFLAHAWVGFMAAVVLFRWGKPESRAAAVWFIVLSVFELVMFLRR